MPGRRPCRPRTALGRHNFEQVIGTRPASFNGGRGRVLALPSGTESPMNDLETPCSPAPAGFGPKNGPEFAAGAMAATVDPALEATAGRCADVDQPSYLAAVAGLAAVEASATAIASTFRRGESETACAELLLLLRGVHSLSMLLDLVARIRGVD